MGENEHQVNTDGVLFLCYVCKEPFRVDKKSMLPGPLGWSCFNTICNTTVGVEATVVVSVIPDKDICPDCANKIYKTFHDIGIDFNIAECLYKERKLPFDT